MKVARSDVVLVDFPFASGTSSKLRPAVVIQNDTYNRRLATTIFAPITSNTRHSNEKSQVAIDPSTPDGAATGLLRPSAIKCENLATVETRFVRRRIGVLTQPLVYQLELALKATLSLT
jgi:mRNA-degrading endonuclease toxin of MazEF toxin-antitoxin module